VALNTNAASQSDTHVVYSDHLARPYKVLDRGGTTKWAAVLKAFDRTVSTDSLGGLHLGFPGQYYDAESGLWQNWHRMYDPTVGRYTQSDPIGLEGGINTYAYVAHDPANRFDLTGLMDSVTTRINALAARGDVQSIRNLTEAMDLSAAQGQAARAAIDRLETSAADIIARELKGSVMREFPGQLRHKTLAEIIKGAQSGDRACKTAHKLLTDLRFKKP
jgi:RHS repeat-associated protein